MSSGVRCFNGCGRPASSKYICPVCLKNGIDAQFCSPDCYKTNYKKHHQKFHVKAEAGGYEFPAGTHDPFHTVEAKKKWPGFVYTGPLRAVYPDTPLPRREIPAHIKKPDYATQSEAILEARRMAAEGETWAERVRAKAEDVRLTVGGGLRDGISYTERVANRTERVGKILNAEEIEGMRKVSKYAREVLDIAAAAIRPGITTLEIDAIVHEECLKRDSYPSPLNYHMFPRSVCTSLNEVICHGIPDARPLVDGDILNLDVTLYHGGFHGDINGTYPVGPSVSAQNLSLIACARECLDESIRLCKPGYAYQDLGKTIEEIAERYGFSTNRTYCGHGINQLFHCMPNVPHYAGNKASGRMQPGQTFTIEPMICIGDQKEVHWPDNWTATTRDGKNSAQFEETLLITETGVEVLTAAPGWRLPEKQGDPANGTNGAAAANGDGVAAGSGSSKNKKKNKKKKKAKSATAAGGEGADGVAEEVEDGEDENVGGKDVVEEVTEKVKEAL